MDCVQIRITGKQKDTNGHVEKVKLQADGQYYLRSGKHYLRYQDKSIHKGESVQTTMKLSEQEIVIMRRGVVETDQHFQLEKSTTSSYHTPYGPMELGMNTRAIEVAITEQGGYARLKYDLAVNGSPVGDYDMHIEIIPKGKEE